MVLCFTLIVTIRNCQGRSGYDRNLAILQIHHISRDWDDRRDIGCHHVLVFANPDHQWRANAGRDKRVRMSRVNNGNAVRARNEMECLFHSGRKITAVTLLDEVRKYLGVGIGCKCMPLCDKFFFERAVVFYDAVVNNSNTSRAVTVRMRVSLVRFAMRCPARVCNAARTFRHGKTSLSQARDAPLCFFAPQPFRTITHGKSRRVVAAILKTR